MKTIEQKLESFWRSENVDELKLYQTVLFLHCQNLRLSERRTSQILSSFGMNTWRRRFTEPETFTKLLGNLWREIVSDAIEEEIKKRLPTASEDEAFYLKKALALKLFS